MLFKLKWKKYEFYLRSNSPSTKKYFRFYVTIKNGKTSFVHETQSFMLEQPYGQNDQYEQENEY